MEQETGIVAAVASALTFVAAKLVDRFLARRDKASEAGSSLQEEFLLANERIREDLRRQLEQERDRSEALQDELDKVRLELERERMRVHALIAKVDRLTGGQ